MNRKYFPPEPPQGYGREMPVEVGADEEVKMVPEPVISPEPKVEYPYNKITKYSNGHKIEFNTTEGSEYINIQHGNNETRITLFADGNLEIIQKNGNRHDEVNGDYKVLVENDLITESKTRISKQNSVLNDSKGVHYIKSGEIIVLDAPTVLIKGELKIESSSSSTKTKDNDGKKTGYDPFADENDWEGAAWI